MLFFGEAKGLNPAFHAGLGLHLLSVLRETQEAIRLRERKPEPRTFSRPRIDTDCPIESFDDGFADCQAQTGSLLKRVDFHETVEDCLLVLG